MNKQNLPKHLDARGMRGILSRGYARYGVGNAPKPGNISAVQKAAQRRVKKMQEAAKKNG